MQQFTTQIKSAGVDTLTCSAPVVEDRSDLYAVGRILVEQEAKSGSKIAPFKRGPYRGFQSQHAAWGLARGRALVELRGKMAHEWWLAAASLADKVSRLDVEVSVWQQPYDHDMALKLYLGDREKATQRGRPSKFRMQGESDGGTTLYIGTGGSRYQARLYERFYKTHLDDERDVWRYEVQTRRERAMQVANLARGARELQPFVQGLVHQHFARRGVDPIFTPQDAVSVAPLPEPETDRAKSLDWLAHSAAPALARHRAWGSYPDALAALGVSQP